MTLALNDFIDLHHELIDLSPWNVRYYNNSKVPKYCYKLFNELLAEEHFLVFLQLMYEKSPKYFRYATQYVDILNLEYINLSRREKGTFRGFCNSFNDRKMKNI